MRREMEPLPAHKAPVVQIWRSFGNPSGCTSWQVEGKLDFCPPFALQPGALVQYTACTTLRGDLVCHFEDCTSGPCTGSYQSVD